MSLKFVDDGAQTSRLDFSNSNTAGACIMNRKQIRGTVRGFAGKMEEEVGKLLGNWGLRRSGVARKISGRTEKLAGDATELIKHALRRH
jgi:uncharacterized protein YjbJ (UPF0337 family)